MKEDTLKVLVVAGETYLPLVEAGVSAILKFAKANGGNTDTIAQLEANVQMIDGDARQVAQELQDAEAADRSAGADDAQN